MNIQPEPKYVDHISGNSMGLQVDFYVSSQKPVSVGVHKLSDMLLASLSTLVLRAVSHNPVITDVVIKCEVVQPGPASDNEWQADDDECSSDADPPQLPSQTLPTIMNSQLLMQSLLRTSWDACLPI